MCLQLVCMILPWAKIYVWFSVNLPIPKNYFPISHVANSVHIEIYYMTPFDSSKNIRFTSTAHNSHTFNLLEFAKIKIFNFLLKSWVFVSWRHGIILIPPLSNSIMKYFLICINERIMNNLRVQSTNELNWIDVV